MFNLGLKYVLIWADRPTRLRKTWFGFLAFVHDNFALTSMSLRRGYSQISPKKGDFFFLTLILHLKIFKFAKGKEF